MSYSDSLAGRINALEAQVIIDAMRVAGVAEDKQKYLDLEDESVYDVDLAGELERLVKSVREFREWAEI